MQLTAGHATPTPKVVRLEVLNSRPKMFLNFARGRFPGVSAGFPSPADDYVESALDLNEHLVREPAATFFVRAQGESMVGAGIHDGDLLVVDRSAEITNGKVVIACINGELTVKRYTRRDGKVRLAPENPAYKSLSLHEEDDIRMWGVVTNVIHPL